MSFDFSSVKDKKRKTTVSEPQNKKEEEKQSSSGFDFSSVKGKTRKTTNSVETDNSKKSIAYNAETPTLENRDRLKKEQQAKAQSELLDILSSPFENAKNDKTIKENATLKNREEQKAKKQQEVWESKSDDSYSANLLKGLGNRYRSTVGNAFEETATAFSDFTDAEIKGYKPGDEITLENREAAKAYKMGENSLWFMDPARKLAAEMAASNQAGDIYDLASMQILEAQSGTNSQFAKDVISAADSGAQMLAYMSLPGGAQNLSAYMAIPTAAEKYNQVRAEGGSKEEAFTKGIISGAFSYLIEKSGGIGGSGNVIEDVAAKNFVTRVVSELAQEGGEELVQYGLEYINEAVFDLYYNGKTDAEFNLGEALHQAWVGGLAGGGFGLVGSVSDAISGNSQFDYTVGEVASNVAAIIKAKFNSKTNNADISNEDSSEASAEPVEGTEKIASTTFIPKEENSSTVEEDLKNLAKEVVEEKTEAEETIASAVNKSKKYTQTISQEGLEEYGRKLPNATKDTGKQVAAMYDIKDGVSKETFIKGVDEAYRYGSMNFSLEEMDRGGSFAKDIPSEKKLQAYYMGQRNAETATITKANEEQKKALSGVKGKVVFEGNAATKIKNDQQRSTIRFINSVLKNASSMEYHIFASYEEDGERVYKNSEGKVVPAPNGFYDPKNHQIWIDVNAGAKGQGIMLYTLTHEHVHDIKVWSVEHYNKLVKITSQAFEHSGKSFKEAVDVKYAQYKKNHPDTTYEDAQEEVVAEAMSGLLSDEKALREFSEQIQKQDKGLWNRIKAWFNDVIARITAAFKGVEPESEEAKLLMEQRELFEHAQKVFAEAVVTAGGNYKNASAQSSTSQVKNADTNAKFQDRDSAYMNAVNKGDMKTAQELVDEAAKAAGYNIHAFHGTSRGDRVGNVFLPERATSGPMAFFTDDKATAEGYATGKRDTSIAYDPDFDSYETQFRVKVSGMDIPFHRAWGYLPFDARNRVAKKAGQLREDWDGDNELILDPETNEANGGFQWQLKEARGNVIKALIDQWLNSGNLFNEEAKFLDVIEMSGLKEEFAKVGINTIYFKDPNARYEKIYDVYLKMDRPFDTAKVNKRFVTNLLKWYDKQDERKYQRENMESDLWDKNGIDAYEFAERLERDIENNTTHAWTSIPDSVTDYLKHLKYDGIKDLGGKFHETTHTVWIPFYSEQIKTTEPVTYDDRGDVIQLSERFKKENHDIRYSDRDSDGRVLSKEQVEFFKNSKVRDENGNLLVCYHGTDADFNIFDPDFISRDNKLGIGFYFLMGKKLQYSYEHPKTVYLNITNPLTDTSKKISEERLTAFCKKTGIELDYDSGDYDLDVYERLSYLYEGNSKEFFEDVVAILGVDGIISKDRDTAVAFSSEQIKNVDNKAPTKDPDIRYSLRATYNKEGMNEKDVETANKVISNLRWEVMASRYGVVHTAAYTEERIKRELDNSSANRPDYAKSYVAWVNPSDFVFATTVSDRNRETLKEEAGTLDVEKLSKESQPIYLIVDFESGRILGHEGRHRMLALEEAGIEKVAVIIDARNDDTYNTKPIERMRLEGQRFFDYEKGSNFSITSMLPLSARYADVAKELFTQKTDSGIKYQTRNGTTQKAFSKALTSAEWKKYNNAMATGLDAGLRINDHAMLVECEDGDYSYKLVIYDNSFENNPIVAVYGIYRGQENVSPDNFYENTVSEFLCGLEDKKYDNKKVLERILRSYSRNVGYIFGKYDSGRNRFYKYGRNVSKGTEDIRQTSFGTRLSEGNAQIGNVNFQDRLSNADKNRVEILGNKTNRLSSDLKTLEKAFGKLVKDEFEKNIAPNEGLSKRAEAINEKAAKRFMNEVGAMFAVPKETRVEYLLPIINEIIDKGPARSESEGLVEKLYETAYNHTEDYIVDTDPDGAYKNLRNYIRKTPLFVDNGTKADVGDYNSFRKANMGSLSLTSDAKAIPLDGFYDEVSKIAPEVFSGTIDGAEQLYELSSFMKDRGRTESIGDFMPKEEYVSWADESLGAELQNLYDVTIGGFLSEATRKEKERTKAAKVMGAMESVKDVGRKQAELERKIKGYENAIAKKKEQISAVRQQKNELLAKAKAERAEAVERVRKADRERMEKAIAEVKATEKTRFNQLHEENKALQREIKLAQDYARAEGVLAGQMEMGRILEARRRKQVEKLRAEGKERERKIIEKYQTSIKKATEGRHRTDIRGKIKRVVNELNTLLTKQTKERHIPLELQKPVADALDILNLDDPRYYNSRIKNLEARIAEAKSSEERHLLQEELNKIIDQRTAFKDKIAGLKKAYEGIRTSTDPYIAVGYNENIAKMIDRVAEDIGDTLLRDMNMTQLQEVYDLYKGILKTVRDANKFFNEEKGASVVEAGRNVVSEIEASGKTIDQISKKKLEREKFYWNNLKPVYAFKKLGSKTLENLFGGILKGQGTWAKDVSEAKDFFERIGNRYGYKKWDKKKTFEFTSNTGKKFSLNLQQMMSLYAYSKRDQALDHLTDGGFVFDNKETIRKNGKEYVVNTAQAYNISAATLQQIIGKLSTDQRMFVDEMQKYLSETMGAKGNEVSRAMYDIELFREAEGYFPLKSAKQFLYDRNEVTNETRQLVNSGFTKPIQPGANNPIILTGFMDIWANHVNDMSMYHAFVMPIENFNKVYNFQFGRSEESDSKSVKSAIQDSFTEAANQYIEQLLKDINGGARVDSREGWYKTMLARWKKAKVMGSWSVVVQQPSAIGRAYAEVDFKYFVNPKKVSKPNKERAWEQLKKYAPVAIIKEMGYFDTDMGQSTAEFIKGEKTLMDKIDDAFGWMPAKADEMTWVAIWDAVKRETKAKHKDLNVNSEEFLKIAGERFTEVIDKTQVYDSVLARSGYMRSKSSMVQTLVSFMAEPTTSANMVRQAISEFKAGNNKKGKAYIASVGVSLLFNSVLSSFIYAMRDDDEDERYYEKYIEAFAKELVDSINPLTYSPIIKDFWSILQGFGIDRPDMDLVNDLYDSIDKTIGNIKDLVEGINDGTLSKEEIREGFKEVGEEAWSALDEILFMSGIAAGNIHRDVEAIIKTIGGVKKGIKGSDEYLEHSQRFIHDKITDAVVGQLPWNKHYIESRDNKLLDGMLSGDKVYLERLKKGYSSEDAYNNAVKAVIKNGYASKKLSLEKAKQLLVKYHGEDITEAEALLRTLDFKKAYADTSLSDNQIKNYYSPIKIVNTDTVLKSPYEYGISEETYTKYVELKSKCTGTDKNGDGIADSGSVKKEKMKVIDSLNLTKEQKDALYYDNGWVKGTLHEAPWR